MHGLSEREEEMLDRLVDGELSDKEYRRLISSLANQPDGWRRCALAFLQAQAWRRDLTGTGTPDATTEIIAERPVESSVVAREPSLAADSGEKAFSGHRSHRGKSEWVGLLTAMAASFLLAFGLGLWYRGQWETSNSSAVVAEDAPSLPEKSNAPTPSRSMLPRHSLAHHSPGGQANRHAPLRKPQGEIRFISEGSAPTATEELRLPVYELEKPLDEWMRSHQPTMSPLDDVLRRSGHDLRRHQEWLLIELDDGSRVLAPVEQWEIRPHRRQRGIQ